MKIYFMGESAFIDIGAASRDNRYLLCIGSKTEIQEASGEKLQRLIWEAIATSTYRGIESKQGLVLH